MRREPLATVGAATGLAAALVAVASIFGLHLTAVQAGGVATLLGLLAPVVAALIARRHVTPVSDPKTNAGVPLIPMRPEGRHEAAAPTVGDASAAGGSVAFPARFVYDPARQVWVSQPPAPLTPSPGPPPG